MKVNKPDFIQIPMIVFEAEGIQSYDKFLFGYIYWFTKLKLETCTASNKTLSELVGTTPRSIQNSLIRLKKAGFISVTYSGDPRSSQTKRTIDCNVGYERSKPKPVSLRDDTKQRGRVSLRGDTRVTGISPKEEKIKRTKKELGSKRTFRTPKQINMPDLTGDFYEQFAMKR